MKYYTACLLFVVYLSGYANIVQNAKVKGVYMSLAEYQANKPSYLFEFEIIRLEVEYGFLSTNKIFQYEIKHNKCEKTNTSKVFGFSDGTDFFIKNKFQSTFSKLNIIGEFGIYDFADAYDGNVYQKIVNLTNSKNSVLSILFIRNVIKINSNLLRQFDLEFVNKLYISSAEAEKYLIQYYKDPK